MLLFESGMKVFEAYQYPTLGNNNKSHQNTSFRLGNIS